MSRLTQFNVVDARAVRLAKCDSVPNLMVIAGPNGCGKSTVLNAIRQARGGGSTVYVGPHRTFRRQTVQYRHLLNNEISIEKLFAASDTPGYEGIALIAGQRDPWGFDDSSNYLKHGLCQIETERQQALARRYDRDNEIPKGSLPDPWSPLRALTSSLLPHLKFHGIDTSNRNLVRCVWRAHNRPVDIDLDDLSSGEKSIVQMFYPLVEHRIKALLATIAGNELSTSARDVCLLVDEPELHLHPNLQVKVLDYMRTLAAEEGTQIVVATHSPTIVEHADASELFLLRPAELVSTGENQLTQIASDEERLAMLRDIFGTTSNLTALQPLVLVEGVAEGEAKRAVPDRKLYRALSSKFDGCTVIAGGGKGEVLKLRKTLEQILAEFAPSLRTIALLDRDVSEESGSVDGVFLLPVSMIENFFIDPQVMWEALQSVIEKAGFTKPDDIATALDEIVSTQAPTEIERRVLRELGISYFRPRAPLEDVQQQVKQHHEDFERLFGPAALVAATGSAKAKVEKLKAEQKRREFFDGKAILNEFCKRHLHATGMSKPIFLYESARHAAKRKSVAQFFDQLFAALSPEATSTSAEKVVTQ